MVVSRNKCYLYEIYLQDDVSLTISLFLWIFFLQRNDRKSFKRSSFSNIYINQIRKLIIFSKVYIKCHCILSGSWFGHHWFNYKLGSHWCIGFYAFIYELGWNSFIYTIFVKFLLHLKLNKILCHFSGIALLYRKPAVQPPTTFAFMAPLSTAVILIQSQCKSIIKHMNFNLNFINCYFIIRFGGAWVVFIFLCRYVSFA